MRLLGICPTSTPPPSPIIMKQPQQSQSAIEVAVENSDTNTDVPDDETSIDDELLNQYERKQSSLPVENRAASHHGYVHLHHHVNTHQHHPSLHNNQHNQHRVHNKLPVSDLMHSASDGSENDANNASGANPTSILEAKLHRAKHRTRISFMNPPRKNSKLLVVDLDHTLMDFSQRFDYPVERLKRPHLDDFLSQVWIT